MPDSKGKKTLDVDLDAARRALARNWPDLTAASPKYQTFLEALAEFHHEFGTESFELRYNLRPPKNKVEEWTQQVMHEKITESEYAAKLKADAERPLDLEMLTDVCESYERRLEHYSRMRQEVVPHPRKHHDQRSKAEQEETVDKHVAALTETLPVWHQHLEKVFEFLEGLRLGSGRGLLTLGEFEATSAHWLAQLVFTRTVESWKSCKGVAHRSQTDPRYLYSVEACETFFKQVVPKLPSPQALGERLREEFVLAKLALRDGNSAPASRTSINESGESESTLTDDIDNESKEIILIADVLRLVAAAGHIPRMLPNSDWGIDGEIEFKDRLGNASGKRVYLQLKSGDSHLTHRQRDNAEVFRLKNPRHADYWQQHAYPVMLVVRNSNGSVRWMDVSRYLKEKCPLGAEKPREIVFAGEAFTVANIKRMANELLTKAQESGEENTLP
jgi:hypothetical protein